MSTIMDASQVSAKILEVVEKQFGIQPSEIGPETSFIEDLGADSLDLYELAMDLEDIFKIVISDEDLAGLHTIDDTVTYVCSKLPVPA